MNKLIKKILLITINLFIINVCIGCNNNKHKQQDHIILDCDFGLMNDDAFALSMLLEAEKQNNFDLLGITLVGGNTYIDATYEYNGDIFNTEINYLNSFLKDINRTDVPYYKGTDIPLGYNKENISELANFYKNVDFLPFGDSYGAINSFTKIKSGVLTDSDDASNFMIESVRKYPGSVVIIAIGPTMNIARAIEKDSSFAKNVKAIYYMGGAFGESYETITSLGNIVNAVKGANSSPYAEYNVFYDPNSFLTCLKAGFPKQYITHAEINVTYDSYVGNRLKEYKDNVVASLWYKYYEHSYPSYPFWDPVTAFAYLFPNCIKNSENKYITVNTDKKDKFFGQTSAISLEEYNNLSIEEKQVFSNITVINEVNDFWDKTIELFKK